MASLLDLEHQLLFYGKYHHNKVNILIHCTCVPLIFVTGLLVASRSGNVIALPSYLQIPGLPPNLGTISATVYATLYILMEPVAGFLAMPLILGSAAWVNHLIQAYGPTALYYGLAIHILSWIAQFIGHGVFEHRAPALLDNVFQAIFLAPLFVWLHILFAIGYRPELQARLDKAVEKEIKKFHNANEKSIHETFQN